MDGRERFDDPEEHLRTIVEGYIANLWTSLPAQVVKYDAGGNGKAATVDLQPSVKGWRRLPNGKTQAVSLPVIPGVPVQFPGSGNVHMTFPVAVGDHVLAVIPSRSTDTFQQSGGEQQPIDARTHDLSSAYALLGIRPNPQALNDVSTTGAEMRTTDGKTRVGVGNDGGVSINTDKGVSIAAAGNVTMTGTLTVTGDVIANGISLVHHIHNGVQPGSGNTGQPVS